MKTIQLGNRSINIVGSPLTPFYYKQAFKQSLTGDLMAMNGLEKDESKFDDVNILQMVWALEKTANTGKLKDFEQWLGDFEHIDLTDAIEDVADEVMRATFRGQAK